MQTACLLPSVVFRNARYCLCTDLSSVLSKDGEMRNELDIMLSTLGTSESNSLSQPHDTEWQTSQIDDALIGNTVSDKICPQMDAVLKPNCKIYDKTAAVSKACFTDEEMACSVADCVSGIVTETRILSHSDNNVTACEKTHSAFMPISHSVLESSDFSHCNQNCDTVPSTTGSSHNFDLDRSIVMTTVMSTSTPLDTDESTLTRTIPSSSACIINMGQQFAAEQASSQNGSLVGLWLFLSYSGVCWLNLDTVRNVSINIDIRGIPE